MKKFTLSVFTALFLAVLCQRCNQDDVSSGVEKIQFAVSVSSTDGSSGRTKVALPPNASVLLTIESSSGAPVLTQQSVRIFVFGESYITEPIELIPGNYKITDFLVVDSLSEILFAVPKKGSPLAEVVANPLPSSLHISKNNVSNVEMQVLDVSQHTPEGFGYVSFNIKAGSSFSIAVFANKDGMPEFAGADGYIVNVNGTDTLHHYKLDAKVNNVFFTGDLHTEYKLIVMKSGFKIYTSSFKFSELGNAPLKVYLRATVLQLWYTPQAIPQEPQWARFSIILGADEATNITVDFGNGTVRDYSIPAGGVTEAAEVVESGNYLIQVTGEIEKITSIMPYWEGAMKKIDFFDLINLKEILVGPFSTIGIPTIDLRNNHKLEKAFIGGPRVDTIFLPTDHALRVLDVSRTPKLSGEEIDELVSNIYSNSLPHNITNGYIDVNTGEIQNQPSEASLTKLHVLRDSYGWKTLPNP